MRNQAAARPDDKSARRRRDELDESAAQMSDETATPKKRGRPSKFNRKLADKILKLIAEGKSVRSICKEEGMPHEATVRGWALNDVEGFYTHYARARDMQMHSMEDELIEIADEETDNKRDAKLRIDTRKWIMARVAPKSYGDKQTHELTGADGGSMVVRTLVDFYGAIPAIATKPDDEPEGDDRP